MKKISVLLLSCFAFSAMAQKDELKILKKIYAKEAPSTEELATFKATNDKLETLATEESDKVYSKFYKSMTPILEMNSLGQKITPIQAMTLMSVKNIENLGIGLSETLEFEKKSGKKIYTDDIIETVGAFKNDIWKMAVALDGQKRYEDVAKIAYAVYLMDKKDQERLYIAANYATNAKNYDKAVEYYNELLKLNFTGEATIYTAISKANGQLEQFASMAERDNLVKLGSHEKPSVEKIPSKKGEILKNLTSIYIEKNDIASAKKLIAEARAANPDDVSLILAEADMYFKANDMVNYKKLINEAIAKKPNDADLYYNLGVITANSKEENAAQDAEKYYLKAIEVKPDYKDAYVNLAILMLAKDPEYVEKMNKITGTSTAEMKKYDALKAERNNMFKSALPYLEKAYQLFTDDAGVKSTLKGVYNSLDMTEKAKSIK